MSLVDDLKKASVTEMIAVLAVFLATIAPGTLILLHYKPALLERLDSFKVVVVSVGFTAPLLLWNVLFLRQAYKASEKSLAHCVGMSAAYSCSILYTSLFIAYLASLSFRNFLFLAVTFELLQLVAVGLKVAKEPASNSE